MEYQYAIGIDVSSASMTVASVLGTHTVPNTPEGAHTVLARLQARSQPLDHYQVAMEATGAYWMEWALLLYQAKRDRFRALLAGTRLRATLSRPTGEGTNRSPLLRVERGYE